MGVLLILFFNFGVRFSKAFPFLAITISLLTNEEVVLSG
ncbi:hypothetical protein C427_3417 [Paraglaciecola psychrophila 170]|uniref:Uncharacterized protein n=1 Tax=Paraglaciecola psychrophila 170 TaxID=1129794 RepID=M4RPL2_9ALTE|nr:hypothetical protein C427_3417 [Paraglaciecola psychrophila 170]